MERFPSGPGRWRKSAGIAPSLRNRRHGGGACVNTYGEVCKRDDVTRPDSLGH